MQRLWFWFLVSVLFLMQSPPKWLARAVSIFYGSLTILIVGALARIPRDVKRAAAVELWNSGFSDPVLLCLCSYLVLLSATASLFFRQVVIPAEVKIALQGRDR